MAIHEVVDASTVVLTDVVLEVGRIALWMQTLGILIILWIIFQIITLIVNRKKRKALYALQEDMKRIERKLDKVLKKR